MIVVITGAAGRIAYAFIPLLLSGSVLGKNTKIDLRLLDIAVAQDKLQVSLEELYIVWGYTLYCLHLISWIAA